MKNLLSLNRTDPKNMYYAGQEFIEIRMSDKRQEELKKLQEEQKSFEKKMKDSPWERGIKPIGFFTVVAILYAFVLWLTHSKNDTLDEVKNKLIFTILIAIVLLVCWIIIGVRNNKRKEEMRNSPEMKKLQKKLEKISGEISEDMNTKEDAVNMDTLLYAYTMSGSTMVKADQFKDTYANFPFVFFIDNEKELFSLSDSQYKFVIPYGRINGIEYVPDKIRMNKWNKELPYMAKQFSAYHVRKLPGAKTVYEVPAYYRIRVQGRSSEFEILVPNYEEASIAKLPFEVREVASENNRTSLKSVMKKS